ncbi:MAG: PAS domain S-box protein [Pseudomonadota bacterium]
MGSKLGIAALLAYTKLQRALLGEVPWRVALVIAAVLLVVQVWLTRAQGEVPTAWWVIAGAQFLLFVVLSWLGLRQVQNRRRSIAIFNNSPILLYSIDDQARIVNINGEGARKLGYARTDLIGRTLRDFMPQKERDALNEMADHEPLMPALVEAGKLRNLKVVLQSADGTPFYGAVSARLTRNARGRITGADCVIFDETDWVLAEESLKHARAELYRTFSDLPVPLFHCSEDGRYLRANTVLLQLMGCSSLEQLNELGHAPALTDELQRRSDAEMLGAWGPVSLPDRGRRPVTAQLLLRKAFDSARQPYTEGVLVDGRAITAEQTPANQERWGGSGHSAA